MKEVVCKFHNSSFAILVMALVYFASCDSKDIPVENKDGTDLLSFSLSDGEKTYNAFHISDSVVFISVLNQAHLTKLTAFFEHNGNDVTVNGVKQISGKTINDFSDFVHPVKYNVASIDGKNKEYTIRLFDLPVVYITTEGKAPIQNKIDWVPARIKMISTDGTIMLDKGVNIRGRGNATWESYPKKAYSLKFDEKTSLLGYPKSKRWVLLGTSADWTKLRTPLCFKISELLGTEWTPRGQNVEFILNDTLLCNFYLCEQIRVEKNRIDIQEMTPADTTGEAITGGVLFEVDRLYDEEYKFRSKHYGLPFMLKNPDKAVHEKQLEYFVNYIDRVEDCLWYKDSLDNNTYEKYLDVDSYIRWWLLNEVTLNIEERWIENNFYMYKERGYDSKLYAGPAWDFDWGNFWDHNIEHWITPINGEIWICKNTRWFAALFLSKDFINRVKYIWNDRKETLTSNLYPFYLKIKELNENSVRRDQFLFPLTYDPENKNANTDNGIEYNKANEMIYRVLMERVSWLDKTINAW